MGRRINDCEVNLANSVKQKHRRDYGVPWFMLTNDDFKLSDKLTQLCRARKAQGASNKQER